MEQISFLSVNAYFFYFTLFVASLSNETGRNKGPMCGIYKKFTTAAEKWRRKKEKASHVAMGGKRKKKNEIDMPEKDETPTRDRQ